jgi:hypothetical protein
MSSCGVRLRIEYIDLKEKKCWIQYPSLFILIILHNSYIPYPANEGLVRTQYKCLVLIYVFPEMKIRDLAISKTEL